MQTPKLLWLAAVSVAVVGVPVAIVVFTSESHPGQQAAAGSVPSPSPAASQSSPSASASPSHSTPPPSTPKKNIAMQLVSSAENSSLDWKAQYRYIEDIGDSRGYTGGIVGFCSGTHDMLELIQLYADRKPGNVLAKYLPALRDVEGSDSHAGLDPNFNQDWAAAAADPAFRQAQDDERDRVYFNPAVRQAKADGLRALGQFIYYDAIVMHGPGTDPVSFGGIRPAERIYTDKGLAGTARPRPSFGRRAGR